MEHAIQYPFLKTIALLKGLPDEKCIDFLSRCTPRTISEQTRILSQGEATDRAIIIARGAVEVSYESPEGHLAIIGHKHAMDTIGIIETVAKRVCAANCTAFPETELLYCSSALLQEYLRIDAFLENFAGIAYDTLRHDNAFKAVDQFFSAEQKICRYLSKFAGGNQRFAQNQSYLANAVGCTRQTVNKELSYLREHEIISLVRGEISILDANGLEQRIKDLDLRKTKKKS